MSDLAYRWTPLPRKRRLTVPKPAIGIVSRDTQAGTARSQSPAYPTPGLDSLGRRSRSERLRPKAVCRATSDPTHNHTFETQADAPACHECGSMMVRNGSCYRCLNCGATSGCS